MHSHVNLRVALSATAGGGRIYRAVQAGLDCMHAAGYAHGDVKAANILFDKMDDDGCPEGGNSKTNSWLVSWSVIVCLQHHHHNS